jgi:hypothetical protein
MCPDDTPHDVEPVIGSGLPCREKSFDLRAHVRVGHGLLGYEVAARHTVARPALFPLNHPVPEVPGSGKTAVRSQIPAIHSITNAR